MDADLFLQQFGHLAQGEGGIKKLRDVILQLAVRGKLVEQNPADEPAEVLLKKIAAARKNFSSDYKLNASKENQPVSPSSIPHALPRSWQWVRLSNIGIIVGGGTPSSGNPEYFCDSGGMAWLTPADMYALKSKYISHGRRDLTPAGLSNSSAQLMPKGSVLFSSRAPIGYVAIAVNEVTTNQGFKSCVPFIGEMSEYIYYYLKSAVRYIESLASGTTFMEVSGKVVSNVLFPLPPLTEQKRIVAKVDELMALCDKLEAEQKTQRTLKTQAVQSTLHHLTNAESPASFGTSLNILNRTFGNWFDDIATVKHLRATILQLAVQGKLVPKTDKWKSEKLGDRIELISGQHLKPDEYTTHPKGIPYITGPADFGEISPAPTRWTLEERSVALPGDILVTVKGSGIGKTNIVTEEKLAISRQLMAVRVKNDDSSYIHIILKVAADFFQRSQVGIAIPGIGRKDVLGLSAVFPPLAEQKRIVAKVDELMTLCDQLEAHITHTQTLNTHLMDSLIHRMTEAA